MGLSSNNSRSVMSVVHVGITGARWGGHTEGQKDRENRVFPIDGSRLWHLTIGKDKAL